MNLVTVLRDSPVVFALACVVTVAFLFLSERSYRESVEALSRLDDMRATLVSISRLSAGLMEAESSQRGYLLTGRKEYLEPFRGAVATVRETLDLLEVEFRDEPESKLLLGELAAMTDTKVSELAEALRLQAIGESESARDLLLGGVGKKATDSQRVIIAKLLAIGNADRALQRAALDRTLLVSRISMAGLSAISLLALFLFLRHTSAAKTHEEELKRTVQDERDGLEVNVAERTAQLTELTRHLLTAREDERNRLARNLHDELGALLTSAKLDAARIKSRLAGATPETLERLAHLVDTLNSSIALGRRIIEDLRPSTLNNLGLVATLEILAREFAESSGVQVHCTLHAVQLEPASEIVVYRLVQEAVTNISKYAKARNVWLSLRAHGDEVEVSVRDDGVGFDPRAQPRSTYGLMGMRFRVEVEGGSLRVVSAPGQGALIQVTLPQSQSQLQPQA